MGLIDRDWPYAAEHPQGPRWRDAENQSWQQRRMEIYATQVQEMDRGIGRLVEALRDTGKLDNTLIMFLADNGGCAEEIDRGEKGAKAGTAQSYLSYGLPWANASNTPFRLYKHWVHEGGISSPFIARWPAVIKLQGKITHQPGHLIDLMATCLDAGGVEYPQTYKGKAITPLEGKSLRPIFEGKHRAGHEAIYWEHEGNRAVRQGKWKLVSKYPGRWEMYDLEADRTELNDLAASQPDRVQRMSAMYDAWAARAGVVPWIDLPKPTPAKPA
jgi:arylsulfatase